MAPVARGQVWLVGTLLPIGSRVSPARYPGRVQGMAWLGREFLPLAERNVMPNIRNGAQLVDASLGLVRRDDCGHAWCVNLQPDGGRLPRGWWRCPHC
jgi:hypothetical protein